MGNYSLITNGKRGIKRKFLSALGVNKVGKSRKKINIRGRPFLSENIGYFTKEIRIIMRKTKDLKLSYFISETDDFHS